MKILLGFVKETECVEERIRERFPNHEYISFWVNEWFTVPVEKGTYKKYFEKKKNWILGLKFLKKYTRNKMGFFVHTQAIRPGVINVTRGAGAEGL